MQKSQQEDCVKLAIVGSRNFFDYNLLCQTIAVYYAEKPISEIISGGAVGADSLAARWAKEFEVALTEILPEWDRFGKRAGFIRNEDIVKRADMILAFWDGESKGTQNSLSIAKRLKKPTFIIYF